MRRALVCAIVSALWLMPVAFAEDYGVWWTAPGWYVVDDNPGGKVLLLGPFEDQAACKEKQPPDEEFAIFSCAFFAERPSWDHYGLTR